mmetsp:Transcript_92012/g.259957  ORF Transcript_92012/g.259957 Transcript_92012/m.259957 type:complete len:283 (-) Transcript_92012:29-877(-)
MRSSIQSKACTMLSLPPWVAFLILPTVADAFFSPRDAVPRVTGNGAKVIANLPSHVDFCVRDLAVKHIYYINMEASVQRREVMEKGLTKLSIPHSRWSATVLSGSKEALDLYPNFHKRNMTDHHLSALAGCLKSHIDVFEHIHTIGLEDALYMLLEDDWLPRDWFQTELPKALKDQKVPCHADLVRLDAWGICRKPKIRTEVADCDCGGAHAMLVTPRGAGKLVELYKEFPESPDCALQSIARHESGALSEVIINAGLVYKVDWNEGTTIPKDMPRSGSIAR